MWRKKKKTITSDKFDDEKEFGDRQPDSCREQHRENPLHQALFPPLLHVSFIVFIQCD